MKNPMLVLLKQQEKANRWEIRRVEQISKFVVVIRDMVMMSRHDFSDQK